MADVDEHDVQLAEAYRIAERRFLALSRDVHLPQLDIQLFSKYYLKQKSQQRLDSLQILVDDLERHKIGTLRVLKLIQDREAIVQSILDHANAFASRQMTTLEAQTSVLQLLYRHQQVSLLIVEGIFAWRHALTRPYPFQYKGRNYLRKMVEDCDFIDSCQLKTILPLRVGQFPLCSNISALKMFGDASKKAGVAKGSIPSRSPAKKTNGPGNAIPATDAELSSRLRAAESILFAEHNLQVRVMRELASLANRRQFVTLLNVPSIVPNCATGILVSDPQWEGPLREWTNAALSRAEHDTCLVSLEAEEDEASPPRAASPSTDSNDDVSERREPSHQRSPSSSAASCDNDESSPTKPPGASSVPLTAAVPAGADATNPENTSAASPLGGTGGYEDAFEDDD